MAEKPFSVGIGSRVMYICWSGVRFQPGLLVAHVRTYIVGDCLIIASFLISREYLAAFATQICATLLFNSTIFCTFIL